MGGKEGLLEALQTNEKVFFFLYIKKNGINTKDKPQMESRRESYGTNFPKPIRIKSFCELVWEQLEDTVLRILIFSGAVALILGIIEEGAAMVLF